VPSRANYKPQNVAWLIEFFGLVLERDPMTLEFRYENNTPNNHTDDIFVTHPNDGKAYLPAHQVCALKPSKAQQRYEMFAKQSAILKEFQDNSPAKIKYFKPLCGGV
jgi:hypothetical protein